MPDNDTPLTDNATPPTTKGLGSEKGASGTIIQQGLIRTDEYNRELIGYSGLKTYEIMRRSDATVRAILQMCKLPLLGLTWDVKSASDDEYDKWLANLANQELHSRNIDWNQFMIEALTELDFGFSVIEKTYEITEHDGKPAVGIKSLGYRKQTTVFRWEMSNHQAGIEQRINSDSYDIPKNKIMLFSHQKEGDNYEGISMLRYAYKDWYIKDQLVKINAIALEKLGIGVPHITFGSGVSEPDKVAARILLRQYRGNEEGYLETPEGTEIEMLDLKSSSTKDTLPSIKHHDLQIALSVLGQFLMQGTTETGSRATSEDHSKLFLLSEEALANQFQSVVQNQLIKQLVDLNTSNLPNGYPQLQHSRIEDEDVSVFSTAIQNLASAGALTFNFETEQAIRQVVHLPELSKDYQQDYEEKRKAAKQAVTNPPEVVVDNGKGGIQKDEPKPKPGKDIQAADAIRDLRAARGRAMDILVA